MKPSTFSLDRRPELLLLILIFIFASSASAETVLHGFRGVAAEPNDGAYPYASLVHRNGSYYGTTYQGGDRNQGTVFELTPPTTKGSPWTRTVLHSFSGDPHDGAYPYASLIFDSEGDLIGTTFQGGVYGTGVVFQLTPPATPGGSWAEMVIYNFYASGSTLDGSGPQGGVVFGWEGSLYGTTSQGGSQKGGTVFRLTKSTTGGWTERLLYSFGAEGDGASPQASLISNKAGDLYGTTAAGGSAACNCGTVFQLTAQFPHTETVLYSFTGIDGDGAIPLGSLIFDSSGNLYGTTKNGGSGSCSGGCGTVFELSAIQGGGWTESVLYSFTGGSDGALPVSELIFDEAGNLYGTASQGGETSDSCANGCGTVFKLSPPPTGKAWSETTLHEFGTGWEGANDGANPVSGLIFGLYGALYGTTEAGGSIGYGTAFSVQP